MTGLPPRPAFGPLLDRGRPEDLRELLERTPDLLKPVVRTAEWIPSALVDAVLAEAGPWLERLAGNKQATAADAALRARLAASGHPLVAAKAFHDGSWTLAELRTVLAAADPADRLWFDKPGPAAGLLTVWGSSAEHRRLALRAAVVSPFPDVVAHALDALWQAGELTRGERLRGMLSLVVHAGSDRLTELLDAVGAPDGGHDEEDIALGRAAVAGPEGVEALRTAVEAAEGPAGLLDEVCGPPQGVPEALGLRAELDWSGLVRAHRTRPLAPGVVAALVARTDCPAEALPMLCEGHPDAATLLTELGRPVPLAALDALPAKEARKLLPSLVREGLGRTVSADELLALRPAMAALTSVQPMTATHEGRERAAQFTGKLTALVAEKLGDDVAAWRVARARLARFRGTVAELLDDAVARAARGEGADGAWPEAAERPAFTEAVVPKGARAAFLVLLDTADTATQWRLLPHLDDRTAYDLLVLCRLRTGWPARALAAPGHRERVLLSRRRDLSAEAVTALAALDDPAVNAGLVYQRAVTWEQRLALVTGKPFTPGRTGRLPVDEAFRADLERSTRRDQKVWFAPWTASGDPWMTGHVLGKVALNSQHLQWRFALGLWERQGPEQLGEQLPNWFQPTVRTTVAELLADPDRDGARERLRELARKAGSAKQLAGRLRHPTIDRTLDWLLAEGFDWDWDTLLTEHLRSPLPRYYLSELAELDGCPELLRLAVGRMSRSEQTAYRKLVEGEDPSRVLAKATLSTPDDGVSWVEMAIRRKLLTRAEVVDTAKPAHCVLALVGEAEKRGEEDGGGEHLEALIRQHLDGSAEAWTLGLRLLPEFTGTVPELLRTAGLAALAPVGAGAGREDEA
ncbi:hypothetical protein [Streptomyces coffeae]|uniref:Secreted protein n=1 Tax=Streptomyces coffeae TaxID=621382 RepID=A0ABS1N6F1_9ACTN|nr:hypothetical protein [Streptomyces coffeae]MBL1095628.1 hypothetical protein [Streptomyces coffeae]